MALSSHVCKPGGLVVLLMGGQHHPSADSSACPFMCSAGHSVRSVVVGPPRVCGKGARLGCHAPICGKGSSHADVPPALPRCGFVAPPALVCWPGG